ncbi:uba/thif-type NAD/fad binding protein [gamma proteobacterium HTCC5015]|nr:uba/thif-type NAD/fad binding protein [gamma proteobacterium HTCC5015]
MNDKQKLRYSRHLLLPELGVQGQEILLDSRALIIGAGGLGSPAALYLAAAGVGQLDLADGDAVELSNLQRQIAHGTQDVGAPKVASLQHAIEAINPDVDVTSLATYLDSEALSEAVAKADVVLDCTDNFPTRFAINRACVDRAVPLISAAAVRGQGQIAVFAPRGPCYRCLYSDESATEDTCAERGVLGPMLGVLGSWQALEAIKVLADMGQSLAGRVVLFDALAGEWRHMNLPKDPKCPVCAKY